MQTPATSFASPGLSHGKNEFIQAAATCRSMFSDGLSPSHPQALNLRTSSEHPTPPARSLLLKRIPDNMTPTEFKQWGIKFGAGTGFALVAMIILFFILRPIFRRKAAEARAVRADRRARGLDEWGRPIRPPHVEYNIRNFRTLTHRTRTLHPLPPSNQGIELHHWLVGLPGAAHRNPETITVELPPEADERNSAERSEESRAEGHHEE